VRNLTQEFAAIYLMAAGLQNWLGCIDLFDLFDLIAGRWISQLPKDELEQMGKSREKRAD
jgi:hypothetical protein